VGTDYVQTIGTKISKQFGTGFYEGKVISGQHVRKVSEIAYWKAPVKEAQASKQKLKPTKPKKTAATKPSGDRAEELEDVLPRPRKDASTPTHKRQSTRLQQ